MDKNRNIDFFNKSPSFKTTTDLDKEIVFEGSIFNQHVYLKIMGDEGEEKEIIKIVEDNNLIGRIPECNIQFQEESVSRKHAIIAFREDEYWLEDLDSKNGTYINGVKIAKCVLRNNDQIDIGGVKMYFMRS